MCQWREEQQGEATGEYSRVGEEEWGVKKKKLAQYDVSVNIVSAPRREDR